MSKAAVVSPSTSKNTKLKSSSKASKKLGTNSSPKRKTTDFELSSDTTPKKSKAKSKEDFLSPGVFTPLKLKTPLVVKKKNPDKTKVIEFLQAILSEEIPYKVLTDIQYDESGTKFTVLGRTEVFGSSKKQMRHITPYSFAKNLIESVIISSPAPQLIITLYTPILKLLLKNKEGYCISSEDLRQDEYVELASTVPSIAKRTMKVASSDSSKLFFLSPGKLEASPSFTPTKKAKATKAFSQLNLKYIEIAIEKLANSITDNNSAIMAAEILARFIFKIFNSKEGVAFPEEGNTRNFEIRLYKTIESVKKPGKNPYDILSAKKLKTMYEEDGLESINKMVRLVNCEGASTTKVVKALKIIDDIIFNHNMGLSSVVTKQIELYNQKGNLTLVLANTDLPSKYNCPLTDKNYLELSYCHLAKLIYFVFDFKALEQDILIEDRKGDILLYGNAKSKTLVKYSFETGSEYRSDQISRADGRYNKNVKFRSEEVDLNFLSNKLIEHFIISTMPLSNFTTGFYRDTNNFLKDSLKALLDVAILDYEMLEKKKSSFLQDANNLYDRLTKEESSATTSSACIELHSETDFSQILGSTEDILE